MRKLCAVLAGALLLAGCFADSPGPINSRVRLDPGKSYTVVYWDAELPEVLDPQGLYRPGVEALLAEFTAENPGITVETRWLNWCGAEAELARALRDGAPPDIWADWQGLARRDHILQIPAGLWTDSELLTPAGMRSVSQGGQMWAWPRWTWPRGLLTLGSSLELTGSERDGLVRSRWDWQEFGVWQKETGLSLDVNDWQGEFSSQALLAATGYGYPQWGGQELQEVLAALEGLKKQGTVAGDGEYRKIIEGKIIVGGFTTALVTWMAENVEENLVLLPMPGISSGSAYIPVSAATLVQFRQVEYKGDDHSLAAAMLAEFMAMKQGVELAADFWAAPAWASQDWDPGALPAGYLQVLTDSMNEGVPLRSIDAQGRAREEKFREQAGPVLADFWAGRADALEAASRLEGLR